MSRVKINFRTCNQSLVLSSLQVSKNGPLPGDLRLRQPILLLVLDGAERAGGHRRLRLRDHDRGRRPRPQETARVRLSQLSAKHGRGEVS